MAYDSMRISQEKARQIMLRAGVRPLEPYVNSKSPWRCECVTCGRILTPSLGNVKNRGVKPCRYCSGSWIDPTEAERLLLQAGALPVSPYPGASKPWASICLRCNREISPRLGNVGQSRQPCRHCAPNAPVLPEAAVADMLAAGLKPLEPFRTVMTPWRSLCEMCGSEISPSLNSIRNGRGCKGCKVGGFRVAHPSIVYVLEHEGIRALKVGVANRGSGRIRILRRRGWAPVVQHDLCCGRHALLIERTVLGTLRNEMGLPPVAAAQEARMSGWSETVSVEGVTVRQLTAMVAQQVDNLSTGN